MEGFTNKEMLERMYKKLEDLEHTIYDTHSMARATNGKVKLHTKLIMFLFGGIITLIGIILKLTL